METKPRFEDSDKVLVVGGGVGGMRTAMDLAAAGKNAVLIDAANAIGGLMTQLDRTFPTNNCDLCTLSRWSVPPPSSRPPPVPEDLYYCSGTL